MSFKKRVLIAGSLILLVIVVVSSIIFYYWSLRQSIPNLPPEEMAEKVIRENLKEEFLPSDNEYIHKVASYAEIIEKFQQGEIKNVILPPFGGRIADLYLTDWVYENVWFTSYIGYDKTTGAFIGYDISARVKEPELKGPELAQKFFKDVPNNGWRHGTSLKIKTPTQRELWTIVYRKGRNKVYFSSRIAKDSTEKTALVRIEVLTSFNSEYTKIEQTQKEIMEAYNEE